MTGKERAALAAWHEELKDWTPPNHIEEIAFLHGFRAAIKQQRARDMQYPSVVAYIAGPFTAPTDEERAENVRRAQDVALRVAGFGAAVIVPHTNTGLPPLFGSLPEDYFKSACFSLLARSDCIVMLQGWQRSEGSVAEHAFAERRRIDIFYSGNPVSMDQLKGFIDATR